MVQLKVYDNGQQYFLDLLETEPIKLTLSVEDITDAVARSVFSRTFRVPSTVNNNQFFKNAFLIEGLDFDVTVKKQAEILYNGAEFKTGHIRLQKVYHNKKDRKIEYEIVFLGETRDFASAVGEKMLSDLDLSMYNHDLNYANVTQSWQAWPQGSETAGLFQGDILYPLINFGTVDEAYEVSYGNAKSFDKNTNSYITAERFKPMIRAKALWDRIFAEAGFTYTSAIADSNEFRQLYISAFGNEAVTTENAGSANSLYVQLYSNYDVGSGGPEIIPWNYEVSDPSDNYSTLTYKYTVPTTGTYVIDAWVIGAFDSDYGSSTILSRLVKNTTVTLDFDTTTASSPNLATWDYDHHLQFTGVLTAGDQIWIQSEYYGATNRANVEAATSYFSIPTAASEIGIATQLQNDYKQIDFIKDMLTKFRLVMAPDRNNAKNFIVEPWVDYVATGDLHDWSHLLAEDKDIQIEPLFFTQSARINFLDKEDTDWLNDLNQVQFKESYGTLKFDSQNELLKDTREIKTNFAPTPIQQIEGAKNSNFLIPTIHAHEAGDVDGVTVTLHRPIKAVTRILFYNGLFTQQGTVDQTGNAIGPWYFYNEAIGNGVAQHSFPMVSYWQNFDSTFGPGPNTVNMNWQIERGYAYDYANFNYTAGISMFTRFWADYIGSLYNKYARRVTAYFVLSAEDLFNFSFDDVIFVNGVYYQPEKITDAIVGTRSLVKVDLIKLLNYDPAVGLVDLGSGTGGDTGGGTGGDTGGGTPGGGPEEPVDPVDPVEPVDPCTQVTGTYQATILNIEPVSYCNATDGAFSVMVQGGLAPYTYTLFKNGNQEDQVGPTSSTTIAYSNLAGGDYEVQVEDACGTIAPDTYLLDDGCSPSGPSGEAQPGTGGTGGISPSTGGVRRVAMYTDSSEGSGEPLANCQVKVHPIPIWCNNTTDPTLIQVNDVMFADSGLTNLWNGADTWYKIAVNNTEIENWISIKINNSGVVTQTAFC